MQSRLSHMTALIRLQPSTIDSLPRPRAALLPDRPRSCSEAGMRVCCVQALFCFLIDSPLCDLVVRARKVRRNCCRLLPPPHRYFSFSRTGKDSSVKIHLSRQLKSQNGAAAENSISTASHPLRIETDRASPSALPSVFSSASTSSGD